VNVHLFKRAPARVRDVLLERQGAKVERRWSAYARNLLSDWQRAEWARIGATPPDDSHYQELASHLARLYGHEPDTEPHKQLAAQFLAMYREAHARMPTAYESASWYELATSLVADVEEAIHGRSAPLLVQPLFGSVPSGMVNATTFYIPDTDEYLIVFSAGLFLYLNLMAKVAADAAIVVAARTPRGKSLDDSRLPEILDQPRFHERFFDAMYCHVAAGNAGLAQQYLLDGAAQRLAEQLRNTMELFVVAHEYGHILEGHLTQLPQGPGASRTSSGELVYQPEWLEELAADDRATELVLALTASGQVHPHVAVAGIHLLLFSLELVDRAVNLLMSPHDRTAAIMDALVAMAPFTHEGERPGDTHPSPASRRFKQRSRIHELLGANLADEGNEMGSDLVAIFQHLWATSRPRWLALRDRGVRPCPLWDPRAQS
jgi:hypothetical protein